MAQAWFGWLKTVYFRVFGILSVIEEHGNPDGRMTTCRLQIQTVAGKYIGGNAHEQLKMVE